MPAIVRQPLRTELAKQLLGEIQSDTDHYYIGIGKSDKFGDADVVVPPVDSPQEEREFRHNLQSIKKVEGAIMVARRVNWTTGTKYYGWDDSTSPSDTNPFYVLTDAKEVYICLSAGIDDTGTHQPSTVEPNYGFHAPISTVSDPNDPMYLQRLHWEPFTTTDGYTWKFCYSLRPENIYQFLSSNHIPVQPLEDTLAGGDSIEDLQWHVADRAIGGEIISVQITDGGSGYDAANPPSVLIEGDGYGCVGTAVVSGDRVVRIDMVSGTNENTQTTYGSGYGYAEVSIEGNAEARAIITSSDGLGKDAATDLKTSSVMMNIKPNGDENGRFVVENSFRHIGVIKNPKQPNGTDAYTEGGAKCLSSFTLTNGHGESSPFHNGELVTSFPGGAVAYVDESIGNTVFYHQNSTTGFEEFAAGESVSQTGVVVTASVDFVTRKYGIDRYTGEVLYIENRPRIRRDAEQQEDIKVVITV